MMNNMMKSTMKSMMKTILLYVTLTPVLLWPQTPTSVPTPDTVTKVIRVHNARPEKLAEMVSGGPAIIHANDALKAIVVRGRPADVATLEQTIRELDTASTTRASRNVELMVYLVSGSSAMPPSSTPAEKLTALAPVVKQLRAIFPYNDYQLLSTMLLRSGEGSTSFSNGLLKPFQNAPGGIAPSVYSIRYNSATVSSDEANPTIHLREFRFDTRIAIVTGTAPSTQFQTFSIGIETDVDLREGQKVVVGKANIESTDSAVFVILSAKLVQ
jgi:hypothetical protein